ncbi:NAD(P)/FAD-dependent oxidoreductase [Ketogulonicigenium robustum]|nr:NAD(P)/FAD-dependent oxidoreductase [Ketogulonicigenium robustum]
MHVQTLIIGAGAAGLYCAAHAGPGVLVVDHARAAGKKIRISGGGRCNFTNIHARPEAYLCRNPHFVKSALKRHTATDFLALVDAHGIAWHEKTLGQLFCDKTAKDIVAMLLGLLQKNDAALWLQTEVGDITHDGTHFHVILHRDGKPTRVSAQNLVLASGGKSIPKMGATGLAYRIAEQFDLPQIETRAGLVPLTFPDGAMSPLAGTALPVRAQAARGPSFDEALLFTHRGLSGPAILQISSYWREGEDITVNLLPSSRDPAADLRALRKSAGAKSLATVLGGILPRKLVDALLGQWNLGGNIADMSDKALADLAARLTGWQLRPTGSEGYRTAEVTLGGIDTDALSSRTMEAKTMPGLFCIGECVDVTGWLGGYNFQWAWSSAHAAGTEIASRAV